MKKLILIILAILVLISFHKIATTEIQPEIKPYIKNEILFRKDKEIPVKYITHFELIIDELHKYALIEYWYTNTNGGIITISYEEFKKLEPYFWTNFNYKKILK